MKKAELQSEYEKLKNKIERQYSRQNEFNRETYDRVSLMLPKGMKEVIKAKAVEQGKSINGFIVDTLRDKVNQ